MTSEKAAIVSKLLRDRGFRHTQTTLPYANETGRVDYGMHFGKLTRCGYPSYAPDQTLYINDKTVDMLFLVLS